MDSYRKINGRRAPDEHGMGVYPPVSVSRKEMIDSLEELSVKSEEVHFETARYTPKICGGVDFPENTVMGEVWASGSIELIRALLRKERKKTCP